MLLSENIQLGVGVETTRGTAIAPAHWVRGRVPTSIMLMNEKQLIKETKGSRAASQDSQITSQRVEGDFEFNVRNAAIGYFLKSLLGSVASAEKGGDSGIYDHTFSVDVDEPESPSLTVAVARGGKQHYQYPFVLIAGLEISAVMGDLVYAVANFVGKTETEVSDYTPAFADDDHIFPREGVTVKVADNVAGLGAATGICLTEFSLSVQNGARPKMCLSSLTPENIIALMFDITGSLSLDHVDKTYHDWYTSGSAKAMEITIENTGKQIGTSSTPKVVITLPKVTLESRSEDRPIDEIVSEAIDFTAHFDDAESKQIEVVVTNEETSY